MPVTVLNVAEKPSVAREVARILNGGTQPHSQMLHGCAPPRCAPVCAACRVCAACACARCTCAAACVRVCGGVRALWRVLRMRGATTTLWHTRTPRRRAR